MEPTNGIIRILGERGETVGTGFIVGVKGLAVTCAHVAQAARAGPGDSVRVRIYGTQVEQEAFIVPEYWRNQNAEDVAILRLEGALPDGVKSHILGSSKGSSGHEFGSFGFADLEPVGEAIARGQILGTIENREGQEILVIDSEHISVGMSGAPVFNERTGRTIGMINGFPAWTDKQRNDRRQVAGDKYGRNQNINFATPSELLYRICKELRIQDRCPYKGLLAFTEEDAPFFFGRKSDVERVLAKLRSRKKLIAIFGASGSGKSSIVHAGVVPQLRESSIIAKWQIISIHPSDNPFTQLAATELVFAEDNLAKAVSAWRDQAPVDTRLLIIIDQFEELFTLTDASTRRRFVNQLEDLLLSNLPVTSLIVMRSDFYPYLHSEAAGLMTKLDHEQGYVNILPGLAMLQLKDIIRKPAGKVGIRFEEGLVELLIDDATVASGEGKQGKVTNLPLVEFALTRLWDVMWDTRKDGLLTHDDYHNKDRVGGVTGSLNIWANKAIEELEEMGHDPGRLPRRIFMDLISLGDESGESKEHPITRRTRTIDQLSRTVEETPVVHEIVQFLASKRLLVTGEVALARKEEPSTEETYTRVTIIHDVLINEWDKLKQWVQDDLDFLLWRQRLQALLRDWEQHGQDAGSLLRGAQLGEAEGWLEVRAEELTRDEQRFIEQSMVAREEAQAKELARARAITIVVSLFLVVAVGFAVFALIKQNEANENLREATSLTWVNLALRAIEQFNSDLARQFALQANDNENVPSQALEALAEFGYGPGTVRLFEHDPDREDNAKWIWDAALSHDGSTAISGGYDGNVVLWDVATGTRTVLRGHNDIIRSVSFFPDGMTALSAGCAERDGDCTTSELIIWDIETGQPLHRLEGEFGEVLSTAISRNGDIVAGTADGELVLWNSQFERIPIENSAHAGPINSLTFNPDGSLFLSAGCGERGGEICLKGRVNLWSMTDSSSPLRTLEDEGLRDEILGATFSQNGHFIVTGARDSTVRVWDPNSGELLSILPGHNDWVRNVAVHPNGRWIVSVGCGEKEGDKCVKGVVFIWDMLEQRVLFELVGHTDEVQSVLFVPGNEHQILTASRDSTLRLWDISRGGIERLYAAQTSAPAVTFGHQGQLIAEGCLSFTANELCEADPYTLFDGIGNPIIANSLSSEDVVSIGISSDEIHLLTGSTDGKVTLWKMIDGVFEIIDSVQYDHQISSVAFTSEPGAGFLIGSYNNDESVVLLDAAGVKERTYKGMNAAVLSIAVNPDNDRIVAGGGSPENDLIEWDRDTEKIVGRYCGGNMKWDASGEACVHQSDDVPYNGGHTNWITTVTHSPDGKYLLSGGQDGMVILWNTTDHSVEKYLLNHTDEYSDWISGLTFSSDGDLALSASVDGTIIIWETENWQKIHEFWDPSATLSSVDYSLEQDLVVAGTNSDRVYLYRLKHDEQLDWIRENRLVRDLTEDERMEFGIEEQSR